MNHDQLKEFSEAVNDKLRKIQLNLAKISQKKQTIKIKEENNPKILSHSYNQKKLIKNKEFDNKNSDNKNKINDRFENYKNDFYLTINDVENMFETTLYRRYINLPRDKKNERKNHLIIKNEINLKKSANNILLPYIYKGKNH